MRVACSILTVVVVCTSSPTAMPADNVLSYRRHVWPILRRHCFACHSGEQPKGKLSLATAASIARGGETGPLLVAGKPGKSLLIEMLSGEEPSMCDA